MADKFPGASERMRDFMGVAANYRAGKKAAKKQTNEDKAASMRRDVLQGQLNTLEDHERYARREVELIQVSVTVSWWRLLKHRWVDKKKRSDKNWLKRKVR